MSIGTGIFLSALFLGCIVLYVKSENKAKWRKGILFSLAGLVAAGVILFVGSSVYDAFEDDTPTSPFPKNTAERPTDMMGIRLGETLATLQFERGKFKQSLGLGSLENFRQKYPEYKDVPDKELADALYKKFYEGQIDRKAYDQKIGFMEITQPKSLYHEDLKNIYITDTNVIIHEKEGRAEQLSYDCRNAPTDPATYFHKIQCGSTASDVMQAYGQNNVTVLCSDTNVETRLYDITGKNIRLWLTKNAVQRIEFSTQPFPPSETFKKQCL